MKQPLVTEAPDLTQTIADTLKQPEVQESMVTALNKLPKLVELMMQLENTLDFASSIVSDEASLGYLFKGLKDDLPNIEANYETLNAAMVLVSKLPKFVRYFEVLEPWIDFVAGVLADTESLQSLTDGVGSAVQSTVGKGKTYFEEAKQRASQDTTPVGVFTLLKLLKNPTVQNTVKVAKSFLEVMEERKQVRATF